MISSTNKIRLTTPALSNVLACTCLSFLAAMSALISIADAANADCNIYAGDNIAALSIQAPLRSSPADGKTFFDLSPPKIKTGGRDFRAEQYDVTNGTLNVLFCIFNVNELEETLIFAVGTKNIPS